jgi:phosphotriesterase-related protein
MHEHIFTVSPDLAVNFPSLVAWDEGAAVEDAVARLTELKAAGIDTIVDLTVLGLGRRPDLVAQAAARVPVHIVAATGVYALHEEPHYLTLRGPRGPFREDDPMADLFVRDIETGMAGTNARAAILKCATDKGGVTPWVERILLAVAAAHQRTGAPISTHTHAKTRTGLAQQEVFARAGVDLGRVVIGHSGDTDDMDYLHALLEAGSYLGMDRFGLEPFLSVERRVATVAQLCAEGYAERMVLSHDAACHNDAGRIEQRAQAFPDHHYVYLTGHIVPRLREAGVTDTQLHTMLVDNPRKLLAA